MKQVESIQLINQEIGLDNLPDRLREIDIGPVDIISPSSFKEIS
jgi:hypothetical protein